jgi:uncharacterized membrane protein
MEKRGHQGELIAAGTLLGSGLGGFIDGIVLHQLLQWHNLLSAVVPPLDLASAKYNMLWDGVFHAFTWILTAAGLALLWRSMHAQRAMGATRTLVGSLALGWGSFNFVEGIIDHHLLGVHHVRPGPAQMAWDLGFLMFGIVLMVLGGVLVSAGRASWTPEPVAEGGRG